MYGRKKFNIGIIVPVDLNVVVFITEGLQKMTTFGNKPCGISYVMNRNQGMVNMFRYKHI